MSQKKRILIICFKGLKASRRAFRQILWLKDDYELHTVGYEESGIAGTYFYEVEPAFKQMSLIQKLFHAFFFLLGLYKFVYHWLYRIDSVTKQLKGQKFDLVIVHDLKPFPLFDKLKIEAPVILDAHEYYFDRNGGTLSNRLLLDRFDKFLIDKYFKKQKNIITVGEWIAEQYRQMLPDAKVHVMTSAADFVPLQPTVTDSRKIKIIHHGAADPHRKTHLMVELADYLDERFQIDLMLVSVSEVYSSYYEQLKEMCNTRKNVRIIQPVPPEDIITFSNQYDIGLFILPPDRKTHMYALPNKFFEYIQSRLMLAVSPNPEMAKIVQDYSVGVVAKDYSPVSMANELNNLNLTKIADYKAKVDKCANELSADNQRKQFSRIIKTVLPEA